MEALTTRGLAGAACDPQTSPDVLREIAHHYPQLRPQVALNPATYPELLEWLGSQGDSDINTALAIRAAQERRRQLDAAPAREEEISRGFFASKARTTLLILLVIALLLIVVVVGITQLPARGGMRAQAEGASWAVENSSNAAPNGESRVGLSCDCTFAQ